MAEPKNIEEHISQQRTSLAQNPECGTTLYNLGVALLSQQKIEEAEKNFERRIKQKTNPNRKSERIYKVRATDHEIKKPKPSKKRTTHNSRSYPSHQGYQGHQAASV